MTEYDDDALRTKTDEFLEFNQVLREYRWKEILPYIEEEPILEVGCGHTYMIEQLSKAFDDVWGIDPDAVSLGKAAEFVPLDHLWALRLEDYAKDQPHYFQTLICSHIIEHADDPLAFLKGAHRNLSSKGILILTCPNALSLHKRISNIAGQSELYEFSVTDIAQGHKHIFDRINLEAFVKQAGFEIEVSKGIMLKPFPNAMMTDLISRRFADALYEIGKDPALTDYCSSLMIVARPR